MTKTKKRSPESVGFGIRLEYLALDELQPAARNPKAHAGPAIEESISRFGYVEPMVLDERTEKLVAGHGRREALQAIRKRGGPAPEYVRVSKDGTWLVPVVRGWRSKDDAAAEAFLLATNRTVEAGGWDSDQLNAMLRELGTEHDLLSLGFTQRDFDRASVVQTGMVDPDFVPEPFDTPTTKRGDLIILGAHRLLCGDSGSPEDLDRLLDGAPIHLLNTDPPYNVKVEPRSNNAIATGIGGMPSPGQSAAFLQPTRAPVMHHQAMDLARHPEKSKPTTMKMRAKDRVLANDFMTDGDFAEKLKAWFGNAARVLLPGRGFYIWGGFSNVANYPLALIEAGLYFSQTIIWDKQWPVLTRKDFMCAHEWCFYGWREGAAHVFYGPPNVPDLWKVKKIPPPQMVHLTEKPVELAARAIQYSSQTGEHVLDLFGGSGSTLIAAQQTGRRAFLMELDPAYCVVIVERFEKFTGTKAERQSV